MEQNELIPKSKIIETLIKNEIELNSICLDIDDDTTFNSWFVYQTENNLTANERELAIKAVTMNLFLTVEQIEEALILMKEIQITATMAINLVQ